MDHRLTKIKKHGQSCGQCGKPLPIGTVVSWDSFGGASAWRCVLDGGCWSDKFTPEQIAAKASGISAVAAPISAPAPTTKGLDGVLGGLASALLPYIEDKISGKVDEERVLDLIEQAIQSTSYTRIETYRNGAIIGKLSGHVHAQVPTILEHLAIGDCVYAYGPAGSGKTTLAAQVAESLGVPLEVFQMSKVSPESTIKGFIDASGNYQEQQFIEAVQKPCVMFFDELDRWPSHLATLLNSLLANGYIIARGHGRITRHAECYILAAGNTNMRGRNEFFPEAVAQEFSLLDRFCYIPVDYDPIMEKAICLATNPAALPWFEWIQALRPEALSGKHGKILATPRATYQGAKALRLTSGSVSAIADMYVFKGVDRATRDSLLARFPLPTRAMKPEAK